MGDRGFASSEDFTKYLFRTLAYEGGLNEEELGGGGVSNAGVTQETYDSYRKRNKLPTRPVSEATAKEVKNIYYTDYYKTPRINELQSRLSGVAFDFAAHSSPSTAIKKLQRIVGTKADGIIGKNTKTAITKYINKYGEDKLLREYVNEREQFLNNLYQNNPAKYQNVYKGWMNRLNRVREDYSIPAE